MILDTHTHFFDISRPEHYWPAKGSDIYRTCMPEDYKTLARPLGVAGTVIVEASPQMVDNLWILSLAEKDPFIKGFVGNLKLGHPDFARNLHRLSSNPLFVGIRAGWTIQEQLLSPEVLADLKRLAEAELELDILCNTQGLLGLRDLRRKVPDLRVVINHVGGVRIDRLPPDPAWVQAMRSLRDFPQIFCKVSALVELNPHQEKQRMEDYLPVLDLLWEVFGEDRLIYGSNWPVCERHANYATVQKIPAEYFQGKGAEIARKFFYENSRRAYEWPNRA